MSVKALVEFVLEKVAIDGEEGTSVQALFRYVEEFYSAVRLEQWDLQALGGDEENAGSDNGTSIKHRDRGQKENEVLWGKPNVQAEFQDHIWEELKKEKDLVMGVDDHARGLPLKEVVERLRKGGEEEKKLRVYATFHRRWIVLTGHAPDSKRVPNALYQCLEEIARHGEKGIIQPELTRLTGQDKRSIAGRTSQLAEYGYIEKIGVLVTSMNTSKLTLSKFAAQRDYKLALEEMKKGKIDTIKSTFTGDVIYSAELVRAIMHELKQTKSGVLLRHDLKIKLGMDKSMFHSRTLSRILRRVECLGVWRRIKVPLNINRTVRSKDSSQHGVVEKCHARCLKYLRDLTDDDWKMIGNSTRPAIAVEEDDQDDGGESDAEGTKEAKQLDVEAAKQLAVTSADAVTEESRQLPIWTPDLPLPNLVHYAVDKTGQEGLSSMELMAKIIGGFYYRPMDQVLHRLTDLPSKSQPSGYINLAIVRETSISHRQTHYRYFSYGAHQELVKQGLASDPWEVKAKVKIKGVKSGSGPAEKSSGNALDSNGFPMLNQSRLLGGTGVGTLKDSQTLTKSKENSDLFTNQCSIRVDPDGKERVDWTNIGRGKGRPRKYEKGKEPYLEARRRREEMGLPPKPKGRPKGSKNKKGTKVAQETDLDSSQHTPIDVQTTEIAQPITTPPVDDVQTLETPHDSTQPPVISKEEIPRELEPQDVNTPVPKRRGRPPKKSTKKPTLKTPIVPENPEPVTPSDSKKDSTTTATLVAPEEEASVPPPSETPAPKRRGRPPKNKPAPDPQPTPTTRVNEPESNPPAVTTPATRSTARRKAAEPEASVTVRQSKRVKITDFFTSNPSFTSVNTTRQVPETPLPPDTDDQGSVTREPTKKRSATKPPVTPISKKRKQRGVGTTPPEQEPNPTPSSVAATENNESIAEPTVPEVEMQDDESTIIVKTPEHNTLNQVAVQSPMPTGPPQTHEVDGTTVEVEPMEPPEQNAYNLMGGMLALSRQQVVLDLVKEFGGCFPGGLELRHAFNKRYKKKNPKAGDSDRRLVRSVVQSLQYKGKVNQITFTFMTSKQVPCTKKLVIDIGMALDDPIVENMTREMIAADGNMWFPPGTDLPPHIVERMAQPTGKMPQPCQEVMVEGVQFDRLYPAPIELLKKKRAERAAMRAKQRSERHEERVRARQERALRRALVAQRTAPGEAAASAFTDEQKAEAAKRTATFKQQRAMWRLNKRFSSRVIIGEQEYSGDSSLPKSIWWNEFVSRHDDTETFLKGVKDVRRWENLITQADGIDQLTEGVRGSDRLVMVNHFGPQIQGSAAPGAVDLDRPANLTKRAARKMLEMPPLKEPAPPRTERKKRKARPPTRRSMAMKAIHDQMTLEMADDGADIPTRKEQVHRNCYTIPREDEDTLLIAVLIIRMLFGDRDRKIRWDLVQKALPHHPMSNLRGRWPRVRDTYRKYLKRIETEFENLYLEAYDRGELPPIDLSRPSRFDVPLHVNWFRKSFTMPEFNSSIELPASREVFDDLYSVAQEKANYWRSDYHSIHSTMGLRANHFASYAYDVPITKPVEETDDVEYAKSIIKANIVTAPETYNPQKAFDILHALPEEAVDEAFYSLSISKIITHKKEHTRAAPGRNYELSEKFHLSVKRPMETKLFAQAVKFERGLAKKFAAEENAEVEVSHMVNDGAMAAIFDLLEDGCITLEKRGYRADKWGLIEGYETRSMDKDLVNFTVLLKRGKNWRRRGLDSRLPIPGIPDPSATEPPIAQPDGTSQTETSSTGFGLPTPTTPLTPTPKTPLPIWVDINCAPIPGMYLKIATAILCTVTMQAGIGVAGLLDMLSPGLTKREIRMVLQWLEARGAIRRVRAVGFGDERRDEGEVGGREQGVGYYSRPGYYLALDGFNASG
ncbi:hypothetical protein EX30DRAFT_394559 [Ascodesmis nigricans]|uniref:Uncharacterized protein n=1 Tax=Ascodesmis nigricans TaxID=341454 RepID=A0A4S2N2F3_9PEZI|nr:hypothetical protein EX30DRAFT_394559 [Ascodesmis nigricans]